MAMPIEVRAEQAAIQDANSRLAKLNESLSMNVDRMHRIVDRAFGGGGATGQSPAAPRPVPSGEIGAINERLNDIESLASDQAALLNRIDKIV